jgi:hypothetical protein
MTLEEAKAIMGEPTTEFLARVPRTRTRHTSSASRSSTPPLERRVHEMRDIVHFVDTTGSPPLLPIFRSRQQAELLALLLGDPDVEIGSTDLASKLDIPYPSAHREVERAEAAGLLVTRRIGRTRLVRANLAGPYFAGWSEVLTGPSGLRPSSPRRSRECVVSRLPT